MIGGAVAKGLLHRLLGLRGYLKSGTYCLPGPSLLCKSAGSRRYEREETVYQRLNGQAVADFGASYPTGLTGWTQTGTRHA